MRWTRTLSGLWSDEIIAFSVEKHLHLADMAGITGIVPDGAGMLLASVEDRET